MGCATSTSPEEQRSAFDLDQCASQEDLQTALRDAGLNTVQLMVGIGFTAQSDGSSLHTLSSDPDCLNPYEEVLSTVAKALTGFSDNAQVPCCGFGDLHSGHHNTFSFHEDNRPCKDLAECLQRYREIAQKVTMGNSTSFVPAIRHALQRVKETQKHHVLLLVTESQVSMGQVRATKRILAEASHHPLSVVVVHVGSGPDKAMTCLESARSGQLFHNFHVVDLNLIKKIYPAAHCQTLLAAHALKDVPRQYQAAKRLGLHKLGRKISKVKDTPFPYSSPDRVKATDPWYGLPAGWDAYWDDDLDHHVYINTKTGYKSWVPPQPLNPKGSLPKGRLPRLLSRRFHPDMSLTPKYEAKHTS